MLTRLHSAIAAVAPIDGVSGKQGAVRIDFKPAATQAQRDAAAAVLSAFDWSQAAHDAWAEDQKPDRKAIRQAAVQAAADNDAFIAIASPNTAQTLAQVKRLSQQNNRIIKRLIQLD